VLLPEGFGQKWCMRLPVRWRWGPMIECWHRHAKRLRAAIRSVAGLGKILLVVVLCNDNNSLANFTEFWMLSNH